ncbi:MAG TPA: 16S rRNA (cytidine(1402)-2'-O)-methyltransferase [Terriglobales bacterium]|nr:16S rRNA (cytidine(1402)-2'-O)-methyltransferase [Terriglobales bacterium]
MKVEASSGETALEPGLYVVATPIGNLEDITLRALRVLKEVDLIACEDTRHTQKLLNHYGISTSTISYYEQNEASRAEELVKELNAAKRIALVTDAGMPGISDPGFRLISRAVEQGIKVIPLPGASAVISALAASGLPTDSFQFHGFLPSKSGQRRKMFENIRASSQTNIFYEAPHRLKEAVEDIVAVLEGARPIVIARELTKVHEEFLRGPASEILKKLSSRGEIKGEITLLIGKSNESQPLGSQSQSIHARVRQLMAEQNLDEKAALKAVAKERGISKSEAYRELQRSK